MRTPESSPRPCTAGYRGIPSLILAAAACLLCSCAKPPETSLKRTYALEKKNSNGPVTAVVRLSDEKITIADTVRLEIEAVSEENWQVELPELGSDSEMFGVADYGFYGPDTTENGGTRLGKWYKLEPFVSGEYTIPELKITFSEAGTENTGENFVTTPAITVSVTSLGDDERGRMTQLHHIKGVVSLPPPSRVWIAVSATVILLAAAVAAYLTARTRKRKAEEPPPAEPPHIIALRRLENLKREDLVAQGMVEEFYVRLSDIVRRYIEDRFGLRAPERTTEEFLIDVSTGNSLRKKDSDLLENFLVHCDLVKFAAHRPSGNEIGESLHSAEMFIQSTRTGAHGGGRE